MSYTHKGFISLGEASTNTTTIEVPHKIMSVTHIDNEIHVVKRYPSNIVYPTHPPKCAPATVVKEIYVVRSGQIVLDRTIRAEVTPAYTVGERIVFPE